MAFQNCPGEKRYFWQFAKLQRHISRKLESDRKTEGAIRFSVKNCTYNTKIIAIRENRFFKMFATLFSMGRFLQKAALKSFQDDKKSKTVQIFLFLFQTQSELKHRAIRS